MTNQSPEAFVSEPVLTRAEYLKDTLFYTAQFGIMLWLLRTLRETLLAPGEGVLSLWYGDFQVWLFQLAEWTFLVLLALCAFRLLLGVVAFNKLPLSRKKGGERDNT